MKNSHNLSNNLKALHQASGKPLTEFAQEIGIPKTTLQSAMREGNTTLDTAARIADGLAIPLDQLIGDEQFTKKISITQRLLQDITWFTSLPATRQQQVITNLNNILEAVQNET